MGVIPPFPDVHNSKQNSLYKGSIIHTMLCTAAFCIITSKYSQINICIYLFWAGIFAITEKF